VNAGRLVRPTPITWFAVVASLVIVSWTGVFLLARYSTLPDLLPVHFEANGLPNGWQYKTLWRVLLPVFVQLALVLTFGSVGVLLLSRPHGDHDHDAADVRAAASAAEAVALLASIWIAFQAYAAFALHGMWLRQRGGLGFVYTGLEITGLVGTIVVFARARLRLGRPEPRPFVPEHWRFGHLYKNPEDPALFVPTRDGSRWTLNFGRPVAAGLMGIVLGVGIVGPAVILRLLLR
jgi:uncharacterized membrane protein